MIHSVVSLMVFEDQGVGHMTFDLDSRCYRKCFS